MAIAHGRHERRGAEGTDEGVGSRKGVSPFPVGEGPGEKIFVILHFKWCIFMQFGVGIFALKYV